MALDFCSGLSLEQRNGLTVHEAAAIHLYTQDSLYAKLNEHLRNSVGIESLNSLAPFIGITRFLLAAMTKLPCVGELIVYRGVQEATHSLDIEYQQGCDFQWGQFSSCSRKSDTAAEFCSSTVFVVKSSAGRCITNFSAYPSEHEVILLVGARLRVTGVMHLRDGMSVIHLEQLSAAGRTTMEDLQFQVEDNERLRKRHKRVMHYLVDEDILRLWRDSCPALHTLWPMHSIESSWCGVTLKGKYDGSGGGHSVVQIRLNGRLGNAVEVPLELGRLAALKELYLHENQLTSVPAEIGALTALTQLHLSGNQLTSVPVELGALTELICLDLANNKLTELPGEIRGLTSLKWLGLSRNQLTRVPVEIGDLTSLTHLYLGNNLLRSLPVEIGELTLLTRLGLSQNQLNVVGVGLELLSALTWLRLDHNLLTCVPANLARLDALAYLDLRDNPLLVSLPKALLAGLIGLTWFSFGGDQLMNMMSEIWLWEEGWCFERANDSITAYRREVGERKKCKG